jgi:hypothetical protein
LNNIQQFVSEVKNGIKETPKSLTTEKDKKLLTKVMTHLRDVQQIKDLTQQRFPELKEMIQLLKKHNIDVNGGKKADILVTLENTKTDMQDTADKALGPVKEQILPLQSEESENVKTRVRQFQIKVLQFRQEFTKQLPYNTQETSPEIIDAAYDKISEYYDKTCEMEEQAKEL